ncbi:hypothetical protein ONZ43_g494 [Nemania bipapillata]|uniref:Uncharacterized protein n=1 Tax=Nemania bipapillata TaxID=110536 RepID=A0ACC2J870_9PEZI|nr:hypothetical protein ONZ43_g494 [Nemania bipapillata]
MPARLPKSATLSSFRASKSRSKIPHSQKFWRYETGEDPEANFKPTSVVLSPVETQERLLSHRHALVLRSKSVLTASLMENAKVRIGLKKWLNGGAQAELPTARYDKWNAQFHKITRQVKTFRIWFLDYQTMRNVTRIMTFLRTNDGPPVAQQSLGVKLALVLSRMERTVSARHVEELSEARETLFEIANNLRFLEKRHIAGRIRQGPEEVTEPTEFSIRFPSVWLRRIEKQLFTVEVLSLELIVRKTLLVGPQIERETLTKLRKMGYPMRDFTALSFAEPGFD